MTIADVSSLEISESHNIPDPQAQAMFHRIAEEKDGAE